MRSADRGLAVRTASGVILALMVVCAGCAPDDPDSSGQDPTVESELVPRRAPALAWMDGRLLVVGGTPVEPVDEVVTMPSIPLSDAHLLDPETGEAEALPEPPTGPVEAPAHLAVGTDHVMLFGIRCSEPFEDSEDYCNPGTYGAAVLDVERRTWEEADVPAELASMENGYRGVVGESAPGEFVVLAGVPDNHVNSPFGKELWHYSVADGRWARIPDPGVRIVDVCQASGVTIVLTVKIESDGVVVAEDQPYEGGTDAYVQPSVRVFRRAAEGETSWRASEVAPISDWQAPPQLACTADGVLVHGAPGEQAFASLSADGDLSAWRDPGPAPAEGAVFSADLTAERSVYLVETSGGVAVRFDTATGTWGEMLDMPTVDDRPVWSGEAVIGWPSGVPGSTTPVASTR